VIHIYCTRFPIQALAIRDLLRHLAFVPTNDRERVGLAFLYPLDSGYDSALNSLSLMERVPEMQGIGITSQWRVTRWCTWLAQAIVRQLNGRAVTFYNYAAADETTRFFIDILAQQLPADALVVVPAAQESEALGAVISDDEQRLVELLSLPAADLASGDRAWFAASAQRCLVRAQLWQAQPIYEKLKQCGDVAAYYGLGLVCRFKGNFPAAEWHYQQVQEQLTGQQDPLLFITACYARALLHLRFHDRVDQSIVVAMHCLSTARERLNGSLLSFPEDVYAAALLDAADGLLAYRQHDFLGAIRSCDLILERISVLSASERVWYVTVFAFANKARVLRALQRHQEAMVLWQQAVMHDPYMSFWWIEYVQTLIDMHDYAMAAHVATEGLVIHEDCPLLQQLKIKAQGLVHGASKQGAVDQCIDMAL